MPIWTLQCNKTEGYLEKDQDISNHCHWTLLMKRLPRYLPSQVLKVSKEEGSKTSHTRPVPVLNLNYYFFFPCIQLEFSLLQLFPLVLSPLSSRRPQPATSSAFPAPGWAKLMSLVSLSAKHSSPRTSSLSPARLVLQGGPKTGLSLLGGTSIEPNGWGMTPTCFEDGRVQKLWTVNMTNYLTMLYRYGNNNYTTSITHYSNKYFFLNCLNYPLQSCKTST